MEQGISPADRVLTDLQKDFKIVGSSRVHAWYAWAVVGIVFGMALGIIYVANRSGDFSSSSAATAPLPVTEMSFGSNGNEQFTIDKKTGDFSGTAVIINKFKKWADPIEGTSWISFRDKTGKNGKGPVNGRIATFTEMASIVGTPQNGRILVMADDDVKVFVNGELLFQHKGKKAIARTPEIIALKGSDLKTGDNEFIFEVRQNDFEDGAPYGLNYKVFINYISFESERLAAVSRNDQRANDIRIILAAIAQNASDNKGVFTCSSGSLPKTPLLMSSGKGEYDIAPCLVTKYLALLPFDPTDTKAFWKDKSSYNTGYLISQDGSGMITIMAPSAELGNAITTSFTPVPSLASAPTVTCPTSQGSGALTATLDTNTPPAHYAVMGTTGDAVLGIRFTSSGAQSNTISDLVFSDTIFNNASQLVSSFENFRLYVGQQAASGPIAMVMKSSDAGVITFALSTPITVPANGSVTALLRGDVATFNSGGAVSGSAHAFCLQGLTATGGVSGSAVTPSISGATSNQATVVRSKLTLIPVSLPGTVTTNKVRTLADRIAAIGFIADSAGSVTLNSIKLTFVGSAIVNGNAAPSFSVDLIDQSTGIALGGSATQTCTPSTVTRLCAVTFYPSYTFSAGTQKNVIVQINSSSFLNAASTNDTFIVIVNASGDLNYSDGTTSGFGLEPTAGLFVEFQGTYE